VALTDAQVGGVLREAGFPVRLLLAGAVVKGDLVGFATGWKRALATTGTAIQGKYIAGEDGAIGDTITCYGEAILSGRITGATPGGAVYGAEGALNGQYTESAPVTGGDCNKIVGTILSATQLHLFPCSRAETVA
jgi:hypothetical protein